MQSKAGQTQADRDEDAERDLPAARNRGGAIIAS